MFGKSIFIMFQWLKHHYASKVEYHAFIFWMGSFIEQSITDLSLHLSWVTLRGWATKSFTPFPIPYSIWVLHGKHQPHFWLKFNWNLAVEYMHWCKDTRSKTCCFIVRHIIWKQISMMCGCLSWLSWITRCPSNEHLRVYDGGLLCGLFADRASKLFVFVLLGKDN